jgi:hydroxymethylpyrimidine/phosphomethylpyrimidine kinase
MFIALTIAGSDSGGGAGIQADLKTFAAHGVYGTCAITAVTAQNTLGVTAVEALPVGIVRAQIDAVAADLPPAAVKTGMLANAGIVNAVAAAVRELRLPMLVVDPVMIAKSGARLLDDAALAAMQVLLGQAFLVTPNIPEAEALTGLTIRTDDDRREAARRIVALGAAAVVIKGGHLPHGTGCTFASAVTAQLALGRSLLEAIPAAQRYVAGAIRHAPHLGGGHGPVRHDWDRSDSRG